MTIHICLSFTYMQYREIHPFRSVNIVFLGRQEKELYFKFPQKGQQFYVEIINHAPVSMPTRTYSYKILGLRAVEHH